MDPKLHDIPKTASCTTCQFSEDFSNYWTATVFFRAKNGTFKRVPQTAQDNGAAQGGMVSEMSRSRKMLLHIPTTGCFQEGV